MFFDDYLPLNHLLDWINELSPDLEPKYRIKSMLIPRWKNFLSIQVDRFDRYPEMITHGSIHICNVLTLAAEMLIPPLEEWKKKGKKEQVPISGEELFLLVASIFLHDIGMADIAKSESHPGLVRKEHGVLSKEILKQRFDDRHQNEDDNLLPGFSNNEVNLVAEICAHHQKKSPLTEKEILKLEENNQKPITESLENLCLRNNYLTYFNNRKIDIYFIAGILRFLDACDNQYSRAGSVFLTSIKIKNNRRLQEECKEKAAQSKDELKEFFKEYQEYLKEQERNHFPKHSVIQKVWIFGNEVVYKPITKTERQKIARYLPEAEIDREHFFKLFENEIQQELSICNQYFANKRVEIKGIRRFEEKTDPSIIAQLAHYKRMWPKPPDSPSPYMERSSFERDLASSLSKSDSKNLFLVVGPSGSGKTWLAKKIASSLKKQQRICFLSFGDTNTKSWDELLHFFFRNLILFLASWGDFLFYNKIRMELEIEEDQWELLLNQLFSHNCLFIFDEMNRLPLQNEDLPISRFIKEFLQKAQHGNAKLFMSSQKIPHPLTSIKDPTFELIKIPSFKYSEIETMIKNFKMVGFRSDSVPEGSQMVRNLSGKYSGLPVVLDYLRKSINFISSTGMVTERCRMIEETVQDHMQWHIEELIYKVLEKEARLVLDYLLKQPGMSIKDSAILSTQIEIKKEDVEKGWQQLCWRQLLHYTEGESPVWSLDSWWECLKGK